MTDLEAAALAEGLVHAAQAVSGFVADLRAIGLHVGLGNPARCVTCLEPWPCQVELDGGLPHPATHARDRGLRDDLSTGHHWVWRPEALDQFRPYTGDGSPRCRYGASPGHRACGAPVIAQMSRGWFRGGPVWWGYCTDHLWGRLLRGGRLWHICIEAEP